MPVKVLSEDVTVDVRLEWWEKKCVPAGEQQLQSSEARKSLTCSLNRGGKDSLTKTRRARGKHSWDQTGRQRTNQLGPCLDCIICALGSQWVWLLQLFPEQSPCIQSLPSQSPTILLHQSDPCQWNAWPCHFNSKSYQLLPQPTWWSPVSRWGLCRALQACPWASFISAPWSEYTQLFSCSCVPPTFLSLVEQHQRSQHEKTSSLAGSLA